MRAPFALALSAALLAAAPAIAGTVRFPADGAPSVNVTTPDGWTSEVTESGAVVRPPTGDCFIRFSLIPWDGLPSRDPDFLARDMYKSLNATDASAGAAITIDGHAARAYAAQAKNQTLRLTFTPLGDAGMAFEADACFPSASAATLQAQAAVVRSMRFAGP